MKQQSILRDIYKPLPSAPYRHISGFVAPLRARNPPSWVIQWIGILNAISAVINWS